MIHRAHDEATAKAEALQLEVAEQQTTLDRYCREISEARVFMDKHQKKVTELEAREDELQRREIEFQEQMEVLVQNYAGEKIAAAERERDAALQEVSIRLRIMR